MNGRNPLISAPHVPVQRAPPQWAQFLDQGMTPPQSHAAYGHHAARPGSNHAGTSNQATRTPPTPAWLANPAHTHSHVGHPQQQQQQQRWLHQGPQHAHTHHPQQQQQQPRLGGGPSVSAAAAVAVTPAAGQHSRSSAEDAGGQQQHRFRQALQPLQHQQQAALASSSKPSARRPARAQLDDDIQLPEAWDQAVMQQQQQPDPHWQQLGSPGQPSRHHQLQQQQQQQQGGLKQQPWDPQQHQQQQHPLRDQQQQQQFAWGQQRQQQLERQQLQPPRAQQQQQQQGPPLQLAGDGQASAWAPVNNLSTVTRLPAFGLPRASRGAAAAAAASSKAASSKAASSKAASSKAASSKAKGAAAAAAAAGPGIVREFVPRVAGDAAPPKLHQSTLFDTLKRAAKNKQSEQQDDEAGQQAGGNAAAAAAPAPAPKPSRKRKSSTVATSGLGGAAGSGGGAPGTKRRTSTKAAAALESAVEELDTWHISSSSEDAEAGAAVLLDINSAASPAWQQLLQELRSAQGAALGLLYRRAVQRPAAAGGRQQPLAVQHYSSLHPLTKPQQQLLSKAASAAKKQAAAAGAAAATHHDDEQQGHEVVGVAVMPAAAQQLGRGAAAAAEPRRSYVLLLQDGQALLPPHALQLLDAVLQPPNSRPCVCCAAKAVMCSLALLGYTLPAAQRVAVVDPELLGWLLDSQLVQDCKGEGCYSLEAQLRTTGGLQVSRDGSQGPLERLHAQLQQSLQLTAALHRRLSGEHGVDRAAIKLEMQMATVLARMEVAGVGCDPSFLSHHRAALSSRQAAICSRAAQLAGREFNLASAQQLSLVLYEELGLAPPAGGGGRGAAKTHASTNETALKQLAAQHELPGLVLEHRCISNVMSKWIDAAWVVAAQAQQQQQQQQQAASAGQAAAAVSSVVRVHCCWQQSCTATGRLSSCSPNLQAVTKYTISAQQEAGGQPPGAPAAGLQINVRDAFVAPPGKLLLSADYSQVELRLLAHYSQDPTLCQILSTETGDVFNMIAAALKQAGTGGSGARIPGRGGGGGAAHVAVSPEDRDRAKRVVYGIVYGLSAHGLAQQLAGQGVTMQVAQGLIDAFLARFPGVRAFISRSLKAAEACGAVRTLMGRRRPIALLTDGDFQERAAAARKVVNSEVQGSAADLIKLAMVKWDAWCADHQQQQQQREEKEGELEWAASDDDVEAGAAARGSSSGGCGARLIAQIHDELLFEVDAPQLASSNAAGELQHPGASFLAVAAAAQRIMEGAAQLAVPLRVKMAWGRTWGSLQELDLRNEVVVHQPGAAVS